MDEAEICSAHTSKLKKDTGTEPYLKRVFSKTYRAVHAKVR